MQKLKLTPSFLEKNGRKQFVVIPYDEFQKLEELVQDAYDIQLLREARRKNAGKPGISIAAVKKRLGL